MRTEEESSEEEVEVNKTADNEDDIEERSRFQHRQRVHYQDDETLISQQQHQRRPSGVSSQRANEQKMFTEIKYLERGKYYNVLCQVVSCYKNARGDVFLRVWDGTYNPQLTKYKEKYDLIYGDLKKERQIAADKKLYEVACYSEHGGEAANLKAGDYVALINVHFYLSKWNNKDFRYLAMHDGEGKIGAEKAGRKIIKLNPDEHLRDFNHIDRLIKTHEPNLPIFDEEDENKANATQQPEGEQHQQQPISDETWDISNRFLRNNNATIASPPFSPILNPSILRRSFAIHNATVSPPRIQSIPKEISSRRRRPYPFLVDSGNQTSPESPPPKHSRSTQTQSSQHSRSTQTPPQKSQSFCPLF